MKKVLKYVLITVGLLIASFVLSLAIHNLFDTQTLIPAIFVLAIYLISLFTEGYIYGLCSALVSVLMVNYAFNFPFFQFNFTIPENIVSAVIMIAVTLITGALTTKLKSQEAVRLESEKERMRANLLRAVSHDLRTPLTTIYGASSAIVENYNSFSDKQKMRMLQSISEDAEWLVRMVENLLSVTRIGTGEVKIIKTPVALEELIEAVIAKLKKRYPDQTVEVTLPDEFVTIPMDATLIEQVLTNLLENAVQHAEGMTKLELSVSCDDKNAVFEIADDGCGIDPEKLPTIFTGISTDNRPDSLNHNAGIGLSVCAAIIKAHDGIIEAENKPEGGAVFRFNLSIEEENNE